MTDPPAPLSRRALLLGALAATGSCATKQGIATLAALYGDVARRVRRPPLVVIPGAFGSRLWRRSTHDEIWPGSNMALVFSNYRDIALDIDARTLEPVTADTEPAGLFLRAFGRDFYGNLLRVLEVAGGYLPGALDAPPDPGAPTYYVYDYDWRLDTVANVRGLHELIERIAEIHGDAGRQVDIVGHSSGGSLARYYARFGTADVLEDQAVEPGWNGSRRIRRLLLVGTPNLGTIQAVLSHVRGEEVGLRRMPAEIVATCPSVPQLMPHPELSWLVNLRGDPIDLDMYDIDTWRELRWSIFTNRVYKRILRRHGNGSAQAYFELLEAFLARHLARGRRFHQVLSAAGGPDEPRPYVFGSDCVPTPARLVVDRDGNMYRAYEQAHRIPMPIADVDYGALMNEPGDGVITRSSLLGQPPAGATEQIERLEIEQSVLLCESHQELTANVGLQRHILDALLRDDDS